ncbi:ParB/RepB/Spo0J family partition protein [Xanthomonas euvesicatoria pv. allii]|uniref:ParB/RepB/Spo0J family partition protein n=1 Tax=Xanthomonas euvesicatoria TaxID=456327 RepID=UPI002404C2FA|nr:ParB/RepB/Spo0J family partition protein [Xanthomonas euvesicatoria]MCP3050714.1 ParB/RepB/Spo0J family partition protein [Xanthomonas euvesicatoria pv. allii]
MSLDLSALDIDLDAPSPAAAPNGKPLELLISDVLEDPKNARKTYDPAKMAELTASVAQSGVKSPISVKPHPAIPGKFIINFGHRRFRASKAAAKTHVPAFIDEVHDDYDQVVENLQREDLTPLDLAMFIQGKLAEGEKKGQIAQKLGKSPATITEHLALIDAPGNLIDLYRQGQLTSPRTFYDLRQLYEKYPDRVQPLIDGHDGAIERRTVDTWAAGLKGRPAPHSNDTSLRHDEGKQPVVAAGSAAAASAGSPQGQPSSSNSAGSNTPPSDPSSVVVEGVKDPGGAEKALASGSSGLGAASLPPHNPAHEGALQPKNVPPKDPMRLKKPVLLVEHDGRAAMVLLWNRPSTPGLLRIKYEDNGEEAEVDAGLCKINCLLEATA